MREIYEVIKEIQNTSSRNDKEAILLKGKSVNGFMLMLRYALDPFIVFGIGTKKLNKFMKKATGENNEFQDLFHLLRYLTLYNTGSDETLKKVSEFLAAEPDYELREFYSLVITKELKLGVTGKTVNKVFGHQHIRQFDCMLAEKFHEQLEKIEGKFYVTLKLDGFRLLAFKENGIVKFFSRQGQPIFGLEDIEEDLKHLPDNMVYDGELLLRNDKGLSSKELYSATSKVARTDGAKKLLEFYVFDVLPISEFYLGKSTNSYEKRRKYLDGIFAVVDLEWIKPLPVLYEGEDIKQVHRLLEEVDKKGLEGVMVNLADTPYTLTRSKGLLKAKLFKEGDFRIVGFEEGKNKNKGKLGRINIGYKDENIVGVGTGLSDAERVEIWNNQDKYIGKIVKVKYFEESKNSKTGLYSLRFPSFEEIRWDKDEPNW